MRSTSRRRLAFLLLYGALLLWQIDRWLFTPHGVVSTWAAEQATRALDAAGQTGVSQTFQMGADGLDGMWLRPALVEGIPQGQLIVELSEVRGDRILRLTRVVVQARDVRAGDAWHVPLPEIRSSRGHHYRLDLRHVARDAGPALHFHVTREDEIPRARLFADGRERWGDLMLETTASRATMPYWIHEILRPWPAWLRAWPVVVGVLLAFNVALAWACLLAVAQDALPAREVGNGHKTEDGRMVVRAAMLAVVVLVVSGCVVALWPTPALRSIPLWAHLPEAQVSSSWSSLHAGLASQRVVIFGRIYDAIQAMPISRLAWTVDVPKGAALVFGAAMRPDVWTKEGDGITMDVHVEHGGQRTSVAHYTLVPFLIEAHKNLHPGRVSLDPWAGERVTIVFETTPERWGNAVNDVPVWVEPRIEWPRGEKWGEARLVVE